GVVEWREWWWQTQEPLTPAPSIHCRKLLPSPRNMMRGFISTERMVHLQRSPHLINSRASNWLIRFLSIRTSGCINPLTAAVFCTVIWEQHGERFQTVANMFVPYPRTHAKVTPFLRNQWNYPAGFERLNSGFRSAITDSPSCESPSRRICGMRKGLPGRFKPTRRWNCRHLLN